MYTVQYNKGQTAKNVRHKGEGKRKDVALSHTVKKYCYFINTILRGTVTCSLENFIGDLS